MKPVPVGLVVFTLSAILMRTAGLNAAPLGTAFTYQAQLKQGGVPFDGSANMVFKLFDAAAGNLLGTQTVNGVPVTNGLFTVELNAGGQLGANAFNGDQRWLEVSVNGTPLVPRQPINATPYSLQTRGMFADDSGKVGIGTRAPHHLLRLSGGPAWTSNFWSGTQELDNAAAIGWQSNAAGSRFGIGQSTGGLYFFHSASDPGTTGTPAVYDMTIADSGNVGIGTSTPGFPLTISTPNYGYGWVHTDGVRNLGSFVNPSGGWLGTLSDDPLFLFTNDSSSQVTLTTAGNLCIGPNTPHHRLRITGGPSWTSYFWGGAMELDNAAALAWQPNAAGSRFGIGQSGGGLYFFHTASDPGTTGSPAVYDMTIADSGRVGIGTSSPTRRLHVSDGSIFTGRFESSNTSASVVEFRNASSDATWEYGVSGSASAFGLPAGSMYIYKQGQGTPGLSVKPNGDVAFGGAIEIGYETVIANGFFESGIVPLIYAFCPAGKKALGGGCDISGNAEIRTSAPSDGTNGWRCFAGDRTGDIYLAAYVICANVSYDQNLAMREPPEEENAQITALNAGPERVIVGKDNAIAAQRTEKDEEIAELRARLGKLEALVGQMNGIQSEEKP